MTLPIKGEKPGVLLPLQFNDAQTRLREAAEKQRAAGQPVRLIILKSRKHGVSTFSEATLFGLVQNHPNRNALVCAHDADASDELFKMVQLFNTHLPLEEVKEQDYTSKKQIVYSAPHNSEFIVQTAGKLNLARAYTVHYLHGSEVAFWPNAEQSLLSALNAVPDDPDTIVILESTANGEGGAFHDAWNVAVDHQAKHPGSQEGYIPIFLSWLDHPKYSMPVPKNYVSVLDETEKALVRDHGATREQLYWRRWCIKNKCGNSVDKFNQEYPATPGDAFLLSGRPAIPADVVRVHRGQIKQSAMPKYCQLEWVEGNRKQVKPIYFETPEGTEGCWEIYQEPVDGWDYAIGADVALGELADRNDHLSELDWSVTAVMERQQLRTVAQYVGRPSPAELAVEMEKAHTYYNQAFMANETNAHGYSTLERLLADGYAQWLGQREAHVDNMAAIDPAKYGYTSTSDKMQRYRLVNDWIEAARGNGPEKTRIICHSKRLADEEAVFETDSKGWMHHKAGKKYHDDALFAWFIAYHVHRTCPRQRVGVTPVRESVGNPIRGLHQIGGIDDGLAAFRPSNERELIETT